MASESKRSWFDKVKLQCKPKSGLGVTVDAVLGRLCDTECEVEDGYDDNNDDEEEEGHVYSPWDKDHAVSIGSFKYSYIYLISVLWEQKRAEYLPRYLIQ